MEKLAQKIGFWQTCFVVHYSPYLRFSFTAFMLHETESCFSKEAISEWVSRHISTNLLEDMVRKYLSEITTFNFSMLSKKIPQ